MAPFPGLIGASYPASSARASVERAMNLFVERIETPDAPFPTCLLPTWGFTRWTTLPQAPVRGLFTWNGRLWGVGGAVLYEIDSTGIPTARGALANGVAPPTFATNGSLGQQLVVASGGNLGLLRLDTAVFSTPLLGSAVMTGFLDDRFLALDVANNQFLVSAILDGSGAWPALGFAKRSIQADPWQALLVSHRQLWLVGQVTTEVWFDAGTDPDQPFQLDPSSVLQYGTAAPATVIEHDNAPTWLAATRDGQAVVIRCEGYQPRRISTHAVEYAIQRYATISDAYAITEQWSGHVFYTLVFPTANACWSYDAATTLWHERGFWQPATNQFLAYRAACHAFAFGQHLVGDRLTGNIYQQRSDLATEMDGTGIRRLRRTPHLSADEARLFITRLALLLDPGDAPLVGQGSTPYLMLRCSKDGGHTWGAERWVTTGALGQFSARTFWTNLGAGRDWVFEIVLSDPVIGAAKWVEAYLEAEAGLS